METPQSTPSTPTSPKQAGFLSKYKFTLVSLVIIILAAIPLLVLSKKPTSQPTSSTTQEAVMSPRPTAVPLTTSNAEQQLNQTDQQLQTTLNQVDTDLQAVNQVNTSQDSTSGL